MKKETDNKQIFLKIFSFVGIQLCVFPPSLSLSLLLSLSLSLSFLLLNIFSWKNKQMLRPVSKLMLVFSVFPSFSSFKIKILPRITPNFSLQSHFNFCRLFSVPLIK